MKLKIAIILGAASMTAIAVFTIYNIVLTCVVAAARGVIP